MKYAYDMFSRNRKNMGLFQALRWTVIEVMGVRGLLPGERITLRPPNCAHGVSIRLRDSDWEVFQDTFLDQQLGFAAPLPPPALIMDLGANVGYTTIYLLSLFPAAHVIAVEPDPANLEVCRANLEPYREQVQLIGGGVWHCRMPLVLSRRGQGWATQVREARAGEACDVEGWDIPSLLEASGQERIGLLKIDIEGGEDALFSQNTSVWLDRVDNLCVEIHGPECREAVIDGLRGYDFQHSRSGQYDLFLNTRSKIARTATA